MKTLARKTIARKGRSRSVHVIAFRPSPEQDGGVGGFDWYPTAAERDAALPKTKRDYATDGAIVYWFTVKVTSKTRDAITTEIDGQLDDLCDKTPAAQTYRTNVTTAS